MRIHHVALRSPDPLALAAFYRDALGLAELRRDGERSVWLDLGDAILMVERAEADEPLPAPRSMEMIALRIEPSERVARRQALAARGVEIVSETAFTLYFRDPEGRRVGLSHHPDPA